LDGFFSTSTLISSLLQDSLKEERLIIQRQHREDFENLQKETAKVIQTFREKFNEVESQFYSLRLQADERMEEEEHLKGELQAALEQVEDLSLTVEVTLRDKEELFRLKEAKDLEIEELLTKLALVEQALASKSHLNVPLL